MAEMAEMAKEAKILKIDNENSKSLNENEIEKLVDREAKKIMNLFHKSFYEFRKNRIKREEASGNGDLDSKDGIISDIFSKIAAKIRSPINLDKEEKKQNEEGKVHSLGHKELFKNN